MTKTQLADQADQSFAEKRRGYRRRCSVRSPSEIKGTDCFDLGSAFGNVDGTPRSSTAPSHGITALMGPPSSDLHVHVEEGETGAGGFGAPDADHHLLPLQIPTTSLESFASLLAEAASVSSMPAVPYYSATAPAPLVEIDADHEDTTSFLFSQLTAVSQRAMRTARRLARSGKGVDATNLMVSSPEVNEALEDTNTLISTVNDIMTIAETAGHDDSTVTTDCAGLAFSALACHQNLMTLFRAICDAIQGRLQAQKEEREQQRQQPQEQQQHATRDNSAMGPLNVAQFVMVLQLLMHLISRMGRFLVISHTGTEQESRFIAPAAMLDCSTMVTDGYAADNASGQSSGSSATPVHNSTRRSGLLEHVRDIVGNIPSEHDRLRLMIRVLQAEMDHAEIY
ncbi:predicted protein [Chaetomium globosum CBS 148.51]|uniref:Aflatoxin regulatory protein domain-containing protein n=1 Tax=Chaetomium globosum (strain ATCC 6205 / CBS 148.51 / DSM 1962 / NBRC 6347 / NRRL 1970) TaxID=306901 RepID=Q2H2D1_CHAGB|nr:uncharacterized protein CHGG_04065 [Chaetomium globosum CBS 148.51]EAQ87446.1 predicted protein [Chaetomium globosum CBS 148.51]